MVQILELFGGIGSPRCALRNIDKVEAQRKKTYDEEEMKSFREEEAILSIYR